MWALCGPKSSNQTLEDTVHGDKCGLAPWAGHFSFPLLNALGCVRSTDVIQEAVQKPGDLAAQFRRPHQLAHRASCNRIAHAATSPVWCTIARLPRLRGTSEHAPRSLVSFDRRPPLRSVQQREHPANEQSYRGWPQAIPRCPPKLESFAPGVADLEFRQDLTPSILAALLRK